ncbi:MAG: fibrobacter succinogenes major paralogous domain-containing protein, partial [Flavobacteriales bacterium]
NTFNDVYHTSCNCEGSTNNTGAAHSCGAANVHNPNLTYGSMTDQEGNTYKTIVIGSQEWMAENLNTSIYRNGDAISTGLSNTEWVNTNNTACNYNGSATQDDGTCYYIGGPCNDGNSNTFNDEYNTSCNCEGSTGNTGVAHSCGAANVHNPNLTYGSMTDQEGNTYKTIVIGTQEWMAENLNTSIYRNGDAIPTGLSNSQWQNTTQGAWAYYNNDASYACPYGKLYNWYACVDARGLCPTGWHVPGEGEWNVLVKYVDPVADTTCSFCTQSTIAGAMMKSAGTIEGGDGYWYANDPSDEGTNSSGFSGLPGGYRSNLGDYGYMGFTGGWWSSTQFDSH